MELEIKIIWSPFKEVVEMVRILLSEVEVKHVKNLYQDNDIVKRLAARSFRLVIGITTDISW